MNKEENIQFKNEIIEITASPDYTAEELSHITEALAELGYNAEIATYRRHSVDILPSILSLEFASMAIAMGFFNELGSDLYGLTKKKIIETFFKPRESRKPNVVFFRFENDDIKVEASCTYDTKEGLNMFFKSLNDVCNPIEDQLKHQKFPENLKEISIEFGEDIETWQTIGRTDSKLVEFDADSQDWKPIKL